VVAFVGNGLLDPDATQANLCKLIPAKLPRWWLHQHRCHLPSALVVAGELRHLPLSPSSFLIAYHVTSGVCRAHAPDVLFPRVVSVERPARARTGAAEWPPERCRGSWRSPLGRWMVPPRDDPGFSRSSDTSCAAHSHRFGTRFASWKCAWAPAIRKPTARSWKPWPLPIGKRDISRDSSMTCRTSPRSSSGKSRFGSSR
jgi:hypothetical protein